MVVCATATVFFLVSSELIAEGPEDYTSPTDFPGIRSSRADLNSTMPGVDAHTVAGLSNKFLIYTRCVTCVTIAVVQLQERTLAEAYLVLALTLAGIVFPVAESWIVNDGWLQRLGYIDSTSAVCVYLCGGVTGCVGNMMIGGRITVYKNLI